MTQKGLTRPVRLRRQDASVAERFVRERAKGAETVHERFKHLADFGRKLGAALRRRRRDESDDLVIWRLTRDEAWSGFWYLYSFHFFAIPEHYATESECDSLYEVAMVVGAIMDPGVSGRPRLSAEEMQERIAQFERPNPQTTTKVNDERFIRRLKKIRADQDAEWRAVQPQLRPFLPLAFSRIMAPPENTAI
jgi:hypothetical protein